MEERAYVETVNGAGLAPPSAAPERSTKSPMEPDPAQCRPGGSTPVRDFDLDAYRRLLADLPAAGLDCVSFRTDVARGVFLRLDVDYDLAFAAQLASINAELGIRATVFVQVGSPFYNPAAPAGRQALEKIAEADQWIGLHYHHPGGELDQDRLCREFELLRLMAPQAERILAWHNPDGDLSAINDVAKQAGFLSVYSPQFYGPDKYVSDSNFVNRPGRICQLAPESDGPVQMLLHPVNWCLGGSEMTDVLASIFRSKLRHLIGMMAQNRIWHGGFGREFLREFDMPQDVGRDHG